MAGVYHLWAADALRGAGLNVIEFGGWEYRAKSSGGYADVSRPWCVGFHHTASSGAAAADSYFQVYSSPAAPISNVTIDRNGDVWLLAAGPTNTEGIGRALTFSKGTVPDNAMNSFAFSIEICNNGVGGEYSAVQVDAAFTVAVTVNAYMGNAPDDVFTHTSWTTRKVDPARYDAVLGPWQPHGINTAGSWSLDDVKAECRRRAIPSAPPAPILEEDDMPIFIRDAASPGTAYERVQGGRYVHVTGEDVYGGLGYTPADFEAIPARDMTDLRAAGLVEGVTWSDIALAGAFVLGVVAGTVAVLRVMRYVFDYMAKRDKT